jgi:hypothetical protein
MADATCQIADSSRKAHLLNLCPICTFSVARYCSRPNILPVASLNVLTS